MQQTRDTSASADPRRELGLAWSRQALHRPDLTCHALAGDASFRRYFRLADGNDSWVLMDAPPEREDCRPFVDVAQRLRASGVEAPHILAQDLERGFLLLEDLGDELLADELHGDNADHWMPRLFTLLQRLAGHVDAQGLPDYDPQRLLTELELFTNWYLERHKGLRLSSADQEVWEALCSRLIGNALEQPQVFVHRDFHSANLLRAPDAGIGVIDFQDAVRGPLSYDFASLVWDRYIPWPRARLETWMADMRRRVAVDVDPGTWTRWCDWMGLQRNLKIVGIFARLHYRDGKAGYLEMVPRFWGYVQDVLPRYEETREFHALLERLHCAP